jgi:hypothetical protein
LEVAQQVLVRLHDLEEVYNEGVKAYEDGEFEKAVELFSKAIEGSPMPNFIYHAARSIASCPNNFQGKL